MCKNVANAVHCSTSLIFTPTDLYNVALLMLVVSCMGGGAFAKLCMLCSPLPPLLYLSSPLSFSFLLPAPSSLYPVPSCSVPVPFPSLWRRVLEERLSARNGCGRSPAAKRFLVHFQSKSAHSMYCNLTTVLLLLSHFYTFMSRRNSGGTAMGYSYYLTKMQGTSRNCHWG